MVLVVDNYDSFTYNLVDYLIQLGFECKIVQNDVDPNSIDFTVYQAALISPGPETPSKSNNLMQILEHLDNLPVIGICLGLQAINQYEKGTLVEMPTPFHGKPSDVFHEDNPLFAGIPSPFSAVRYHSWKINELPSSLKAIAHTDDGTIMATKHVKKAWYGLQFHPESILTEHGKTILANWASIVGI